MSEENLSLMVRDDSKHAISFTPDAVALKDEALSNASLVAIVNSPVTQEVAVDAQRSLRRVLKLVEDARKAVKAPIIDFGRAIDDAAKSFIKECAAEELRIAKLVGDFQALELAKARAAEAARQAEIRKAEEERRRAEEALRAEEARKKAEFDAQQAELARKATEAADAESRARIAAEQAEIERQRKASQAQSHAELERIQEEHCNAVSTLPQVAPTRTEGQIVREEWEITVTDIHALYRAHPLCVKLAPLLNEIKQLLDSGITPKGVLAKKVAKASVRLGREPKDIEVATA